MADITGITSHIGMETAGAPVRKKNAIATQEKEEAAASANIQPPIQRNLGDTVDISKVPVAEDSKIDTSGILDFRPKNKVHDIEEQSLSAQTTGEKTPHTENQVGEQIGRSQGEIGQQKTETAVGHLEQGLKEETTVDSSPANTPSGNNRSQANSTSSGQSSSGAGRSSGKSGNPTEQAERAFAIFQEKVQNLTPKQKLQEINKAIAEQNERSNDPEYRDVAGCMSTLLESLKQETYNDLAEKLESQINSGSESSDTQDLQNGELEGVSLVEMWNVISGQMNDGNGIIPQENLFSSVLTNEKGSSKPPEKRVESLSGDLRAKNLAPEAMPDEARKIHDEMGNSEHSEKLRNKKALEMLN
jgi:hypothetical protein